MLMTLIYIGGTMREDLIKQSTFYENKKQTRFIYETVSTLLCTHDIHIRIMLMYPGAMHEEK